jgi:hypothetical protein
MAGRDIRTVVDIHTKVLTLPSRHTIVGQGSDQWLRNCKAVWLRAYAISGNGSALPNVVYLVMGINECDGFTSFTNHQATAAASGMTSYKETRIPLYSVNNGYLSDEGRLIASVERGINMSNARLYLETFDTATNTFTAFTDYTQLVLEFQVEIGQNVNNVRVPHGV